MPLAERRNIQPRHLRLRCPSCGGEGDGLDHRHDCPRIDTCGQYGPPWVMGELHPDDPMLDPRRAGESLAEFRVRADAWSEALDRHRREVHGLGVSPW